MNKGEVFSVKNEIVPKVFEINYCAYLGMKNFSLKIEDGKTLIILLPYDFDFKFYPNKDIIPSEEEWKDFWKIVDQIGMWNWLEQYSPQYNEVWDGYYWNLKIQLGNKKIESSGSNAYPGKQIGEIVDADMSSSFKMFLEAVEKLTGVKIDRYEDDWADMSIKKCLKDWNVTVEALGKGNQTILIRNYKTNVNEFLLYPTINYSLKEDYMESFQTKDQEFVKENSLPEKKDDKVLIKYFATLEKIIETPIFRIPSDKHYIWTKDHVKNYLTGKTAFIWILRVFKLKEPYWAEPTPGAIRYVNLKEEVFLDGIEPVLSELEFNQVLSELNKL